VCTLSSHIQFYVLPSRSCIPSLRAAYIRLVVPRSGTWSTSSDLMGVHFRPSKTVRAMDPLPAAWMIDPVVFHHGCFLPFVLSSFVFSPERLEGSFLTSLFLWLS
jgi:hypothetical protein